MSRKLFFFILLIAAMSPAVHAAEDCYDWFSTDAILAGDPPDKYCPASMAFDENAQKMALLTVDCSESEPNMEALWYYDSNKWDKAWEGSFPTSFLPYPPLALYYDCNLNSLVCIGSMANGSGEGPWTLTAFKYDPFLGLVWLEDTGGPYFAESGPISISNDSIRKRAVILGASVMWSGPATLEFDGHNFYEIANPPGADLFKGISGYNPDTGKVVFFGYLSSLDSKPSTWEYDGSGWVQVQTPVQPSYSVNQYYYYNTPGMAYVPQSHGLLALEYSDSYFNTWLFDSEWHQLEPGHSPAQGFTPLMAYNPATNRVVVLDYADNPPFYNVTWEFRTHHCRPVSRP